MYNDVAGLRFVRENISIDSPTTTIIAQLYMFNRQHHISLYGLSGKLNNGPVLVCVG